MHPGNNEGSSDKVEANGNHFERNREEMEDLFLIARKILQDIMKINLD